MIDFSQVKKWFIDDIEVKKVINVLDSTVLWQAIQRVLKEWRGLSPLTCTSTVAGNFEDIKIYGNSVQNVELYSSDLWQDGFINSSGSADPVASSSYPNAKYFKLALKQGQVVQFTVEPNDTANGRVRVIDPTTNIVQTTIAIGTNIGYVTSTNTENAGFRSATFTAQKDVTLAFMDIRGTIGTYTNFSLITDVSPSNPIEVESVGDKTANIIDIQGMGIKSSTAKSGTDAGLTWEVLPNGGLKINGTCTSDTYKDLFIEGSSVSKSSASKYPKAMKAGTYAIKTLRDNYDGTVEGSPISLFSIYYDSNLTSMGTNSVSTGGADRGFNLPRDAVYVRTFVRVLKDTVLTDFVCYPMIIEGNVVGDYEPYGYKIPVKVNGKNLYNASVATGTSRLYVNSTGSKRTTGDTNYQDYFSTDDPNFAIKVNGGETLTFSNSFGEKTVTVATWDKDGNFIARLASATGTLTLNDNVREIIPYFYSAGAFANVTENDWIQVEVGSQATPYEPYVEPVTTNIYLDEPLRKVGEYADTLSVDGTDVTVVRNVEVIDDTGTKTIEESLIHKVPSTTETYTIKNPIMALDNTSIINVDTTIAPLEIYASEWVEE